MPTSESRRSCPARVWLALAGVLLASAPARLGPGPARVQPASSCPRPSRRKRCSRTSRSSSSSCASGSRSRADARPDPVAPPGGWLSGEHARRLPPGRRHAPWPRSSARGPSTPSGARHAVAARRRTRSGLVDSTRAMSDSLRAVLDSIKMLRADSARADSLADSLGGPPRGRAQASSASRPSDELTTQFQPAQAGPVDENYRLGPGDALVLILTGDVERSHTLEVTREGFVVIPQVGQVYVANLTLGQLEDQLYGRLGRVYSGVRRGPNATHQVPALDRAAPQYPGLRRGRRGPARRLPDVQRRHGAHRALCRGRPDHQRQLPAGRDPPRRQAGGQPGPLRLPAPRHQPHGHPAPDRRRRVRAGARRPRHGGGQGHPPGDLRAAPRPRRCATRSRFAGGFDPTRRAGAGDDSPDPAAGLARRQAAAPAWSSRSAPTSSSAAWRPRCRWRPGTR